MKDVRLGADGRVSFTVPGRSLFTERPRTLAEAVRLKETADGGHTPNELHFTGRARGNRLTLTCSSADMYECPDKTLTFQKGAWSPPPKPKASPRP